MLGRTSKADSSRPSTSKKEIVLSNVSAEPQPEQASSSESVDGTNEKEKPFLNKTPTNVKDIFATVASIIPGFKRMTAEEERAAAEARARRRQLRMKQIREHKMRLILLSVGLIVAATSLALFLSNKAGTLDKADNSTEKEEPANKLKGGKLYATSSKTLVHKLKDDQKDSTSRTPNELKGTTPNHCYNDVTTLCNVTCQQGAFNLSISSCCKKECLLTSEAMCRTVFRKVGNDHLLCSKMKRQVCGGNESSSRLYLNLCSLCTRMLGDSSLKQKPFDNCQ